MEPFATLEELESRLDWDLSDEEKRDAEDALEHLSEQARYYGRNWTSAATAPRLVKSLVLAAAKRYLRNPDGYTQSRAGDETLTWTDRGADAGSAIFSDREVKMLRGLGGSAGIISAPVVAWGTRDRCAPEGYVPVAGWPGEKAFPYFGSDKEPW